MIRLPAEWEEQNFVQLVFPHENTDWEPYLDEAIETFVNIAKEIAKRQKCLIVTKNLAQIKAKFPKKKNLDFIRLDSDDTWSRDFGGITIVEDDEYIVCDFNFNAWGKKFAYKKDNKITNQLKLKGKLKEYSHRNIPFVLEGGSIESDGKGVILTTTQCLMEKNRNPRYSKKAIEKKLEDTLGAKKVLWLDYGSLEGDDTDSHIDTLARLVNEDTIVYQSCDDIEDSHYEELQKMHEQLQTFTNLKGKKYKLIALPWISPKFNEDERLPATYANFLIINKAVLVPIHNDTNDEKALKIIKEVFPKHEIVGIDCSTLIKQHGSLHCVTMQYPKIK